MDSSDPLAGHVLVLFDGVCNLCNGFVQFVIRRDPSARFRFASLQSGFAHQQLTRFGLDPGTTNSIVVIDRGTVYQRSNAALHVAGHLPGLWPALKVFKVIPRFIRDGLYDLMAASRYRWFGRRESCWLPSPALKARFLE